MHLFRRPDGDADLGHKFVRVAGQTVVDHRDLAREVRRGERVRAQVVHQARILRRGLGVAAAKAHGGARRLGQDGHVAVEGVLVVEHEKRAVIRRKLSGREPRGREAHAHLAEEHHGLRLRALEHADGRLHVEKAVQLERAGHPHDAARGAAHEADGAELGCLRIVQLAQAALNRAGAPEESCRFEGGWPDAERRVLCLEPEDCYPASPVCCVRLRCRALAGAQLPVHKDYLGSLMGLELRREALGDIVLPPEEPGTAYLFALEPAAALICQELRSVGRTEVTAQQLALDEVPEFAQAERQLQTATVSSLRLDAVLAAMLRCSRGMAAELVAAGRVEINHLPVSSAHAPVYESDVFTVRGKGRFRLTAPPGKSKKDRQIIEFFQY